MPIYRYSYTAGGNGDYSDMSRIFRVKNDKAAVKSIQKDLLTFKQLGGSVCNEKLERGRARLVIRKEFVKFTPKKEIPLRNK